MENNAVVKTVKNKARIINLQPETVEKYKIKNYHDFYLKFDVSLLAEIPENFKNNSKIFSSFIILLRYKNNKAKKFQDL